MKWLEGPEVDGVQQKLTAVLSVRWPASLSFLDPGPTQPPLRIIKITQLPKLKIFCKESIAEYLKQKNESVSWKLKWK